MRKGFFLMLSALFLFVACDSNAPGGIRLHYSWVDADGNDITPPDLSLLFAWGELTYSGETKTTEPVWLGDDDATLHFSGLPYGIPMSMTITMRIGETGGDTDIIGAGDAPEERPDNVAYYCTSQEFKLVRGKVTEVENGCVLQKGPALGNDGSEAPAMKLFYRRTAADAPVEITATANVTPLSEIEIHVDPRNADSIVVANDPAFSLGKKIFTVADLQKDAEDKVIVPAWDLNGGLFAETETPQDGIRLVYVKLKQAIGFESPAANAKVVLDTTPPQVTSGYMTREPLFAQSVRTVGDVTEYHFSVHDPYDDAAEVTGSLVLYTNEAVTAVHDAIARETTTLAEVSLADLGLTEVVAGENRITVSGTITDDVAFDGTYEVLVSLEDAVGNFAEGTDGYTKVPNLLLVIQNTPPSEAAIDMSKVLYVRKPWGTQDTEMVPRMSLTGTAITTDTSISSVIAYAPTGLMLGQADLDGGSFDIASLTGGDLSEIYLNPVTFSGAKLPMPGLKVTEVEWHATMGGKVPGNNYNNPHIFRTNGIIDNTIEQNIDYLQEPFQGGIALTNQSGKGIWNKWEEKEKPLARCEHAMAYDSARGKVVLFGGGNDSTWEWNGTNWTQLNPTTKPSTRSGHAMAYDSAYGKVILFGGGYTLPSGLDNETWEWDGATWTLLDPITKPSARNRMALSYDSVRGKIVLFGGWTGAYNDETWEWDGTNWTQMNPATKPSARWGHAMTYDSTRETMILFGGYDGAYNDETWEWNGANWVRLVPITTPSGRVSHTMAYDSACGKVFLFGGSTYLDESVDFNETWEWDGTNWNLLNSTSKPTERQELAMAYDSARGKMLLFGGRINASPYVSDETWEWDGANWTQVNLTGNKPSARSAHSMTYDNIRDKIVLFGGDAGSFSNETWEWNGINWAMINPVTKPSARGYHAMTYDDARNKVILLGGRTDVSVGNNETWEWNGINWSQLSPDTKPNTQGWHAMAYDGLHEKIILFGGYVYGSGYKDEMWEWEGTNWIKLSPASRPSARDSHAMAYDSAHGKILLFGGRTDSGPNDETWEWNGMNWTQLNPSIKPSARYGHAMAYDSVRAKILMFGGDTWEWDGMNWTQLNPATQPLVGDGHAMVYDSSRRKVILFGGYKVTQKDELWEWNGGGNDRPGQIMNIAFESSSVKDYSQIQSLSILFNAGGLGDITGTPTNGVDLMTWKHDRWVKVSSNTADPDNLAPVTWETTDPVEIQTLLNSGLRKFNFAVVPTAPNGFLTDMGSIATDYAEVVVRYRIP